jgi:hypothetical protein
LRQSSRLPERWQVAPLHFQILKDHNVLFMAKQGKGFKVDHFFSKQRPVSSQLKAIQQLLQK